ncbi:MAG: hypothetical protein ACRDMH_12210 [Solirubrobacterales bacterium]
MPGSGFEMHCSGCGSVHEISTGDDSCLEHGNRWEYNQYVCPTCLLIKSRSTLTCCDPEPAVCEVCGSGLTPWTGRVWHERTPDGMPIRERVGGPCPRCGETVTERDSSVMILWD